MEVSDAALFAEVLTRIWLRSSAALRFDFRVRRSTQAAATEPSEAACGRYRLNRRIRTAALNRRPRGDGAVYW